MEFVELGNYIKILSGYAFNSKLFNDKNEGIPIIRIRDVGKPNSETFFSGDFDDKFVIEKGDFLVGMDGDFRLAEWKGVKSLLNQRVCKIDTIDNDILFKKYLFYVLPKELKRIEDTTSYATVKHLSVKKINSIKIPLPPLPEQQRIARLLDEADKLRQLNQQLIQKYEQLPQSLFLEMFGNLKSNSKKFDFPKLKELCNVSQGMQIAIKNRHKTDGKNRYKYITNAYLNGKKDAEYIENPRESVICKKEDILMTRTGNTGTVITNVDGVFHNNFFKIDWNREKLNRVYFVHFLSNPNIKNELIKRASTTTIPDLNHGQFYDLNIVVPPLDLQTQFAERVGLIEAQKQQAQEALQKSEDLFNSLLQEVFKG